eukprot:GHVU01060033.1.p1 GENE.GHVU01060033.1~~GHVU01060033.1.p1  ORF type:complete len:1172 (-),score=160.60 GHVU01060033.1:884-4399(-)
MLSRAREAEIIIGDRTTLESATDGKELWKETMTLLETHGQVLRGFPVFCEKHKATAVAATPEELTRMHGNGGCGRPCELERSCGHACRLDCHQGPCETRPCRECKRREREEASNQCPISDSFRDAWADRLELMMSPESDIGLNHESVKTWKQFWYGNKGSFTKTQQSIVGRIQTQGAASAGVSAALYFACALRAGTGSGSISRPSSCFLFMGASDGGSERAMKKAANFFSELSRMFRATSADLAHYEIVNAAKLLEGEANVIALVDKCVRRRQVSRNGIGSTDAVAAVEERQVLGKGVKVRVMFDEASVESGSVHYEGVVKRVDPETDTYEIEFVDGMVEKGIGRERINEVFGSAAAVIYVPDAHLLISRGKWILHKLIEESQACSDILTVILAGPADDMKRLLDGESSTAAMRASFTSVFFERDEPRPDTKSPNAKSPKTKSPKTISRSLKASPQTQSLGTSVVRQQILQGGKTKEAVGQCQEELQSTIHHAVGLCHDEEEQTRAEQDTGPSNARLKPQQPKTQQKQNEVKNSRQQRRPEVYDASAVKEEVRMMIGCEGAKRWLLGMESSSLSSGVFTACLEGHDVRLSKIFVGPRGTGKRTAAALYGKLMAALGYLNSVDILLSEFAHLPKKPSLGNLLVADAGQLLELEVLREALKAALGADGNYGHAVVLCGTSDQISQVRSLDVWNDVCESFDTSEVEFQQFQLDELEKICLRCCENHGYICPVEANQSVRAALRDRIGAPNFAGGTSAELLAKSLMRNTDGRVITSASAQAPPPLLAALSLAGGDKLIENWIRTIFDVVEDWKHDDTAPPGPRFGVFTCVYVLVGGTRVRRASAVRALGKLMVELGMTSDGEAVTVEAARLLKDPTESHNRSRYVALLEGLFEEASGGLLEIHDAEAFYRNTEKSEQSAMVIEEVIRLAGFKFDSQRQQVSGESQPLLVLSGDEHLEHVLREHADIFRGVPREVVRLGGDGDGADDDGYREKDLVSYSEGAMLRHQCLWVDEEARSALRTAVERIERRYPMSPTDRLDGVDSLVGRIMRPGHGEEDTCRAAFIDNNEYASEGDSNGEFRVDDVVKAERAVLEEAEQRHVRESAAAGRRRCHEYRDIELEEEEGDDDDGDDGEVDLQPSSITTSCKQLRRRMVSLQDKGANIRQRSAAEEFRVTPD